MIIMDACIHFNFNSLSCSLLQDFISYLHFTGSFYLILDHFSNSRGPRSNFWSKLGPVCTLSIHKTVHDICRAHSDGVFMGFGANSGHFGTYGDLHRRLGGNLGAKLACLWPSRVPKLPEIESKCMILVRLTPAGCKVVF